MADPVTRQIPWLRVFVEGVVIVASILLAFALDAWWDRRGERVWERAQLEALHGEFTENHIDLSSALEVHELVRARSDSLIEYLRQTRFGTSVEVADTVLAAVLITPTYDPALGTLGALLTSGDLSRIRNQRLVALLARWPGAVEDVTEDEQSVVRHVQTQLVPLLGSRVDLAEVQVLRSSVVNGVPVRRGVVGGFGPGAAGAQLLTSELSVISALGANQDYHRLSSGGLRRLQGLNTEILDALEDELAR
jgi:hypothetical protein